MSTKKSAVFPVARWIVLGAVLLAVTVLGILHQVLKGGAVPVGVDALCPFGALESAWAWISSGNLLPKIAVSSGLLWLATGVSLLAFRRSFCGNVCPLGALQELVSNLGRKVLGKHRRPLPQWLDRPARWAKYGVLAGVLILSWALADLVIRPFDPWVAYMHLSSAEVLTELGVGLGILLASLALSFLYDRFFCKYLCPMGAATAMVGKLGWFRVRRQEAACISCGKCDAICPVNLKVSKLAQVTSGECLACGKCVQVCPQPAALYLGGPARFEVKALSAAVDGGRTKLPGRISPLFLVLGTAVLFGGVVLASSLAGAFQWQMSSLEQLMHSREQVGDRPAGAVEAPTETAASALPAFDPSLIRGKDTLAEVSRLSGIPAAEFTTRFNLKPGDLDRPIKDVAHRDNGFETEEVREFVRARQTAP